MPVQGASCRGTEDTPSPLFSSSSSSFKDNWYQVLVPLQSHTRGAYGSPTGKVTVGTACCPPRMVGVATGGASVGTTDTCAVGAWAVGAWAVGTGTVGGATVTVGTIVWAAGKVGAGIVGAGTVGTVTVGAATVGTTSVGTGSVTVGTGGTSGVGTPGKVGSGRGTSVGTTDKVGRGTVTVGRAAVIVGSTGVRVGKTGRVVCVAVGATAVVLVGGTVGGNGAEVRVASGSGVRVRVDVALGAVAAVAAVSGERVFVGVEAAGLPLVGVGCDLAAAGVGVVEGTTRISSAGGPPTLVAVASWLAGEGVGDAIAAGADVISGNTASSWRAEVMV